MLASRRLARSPIASLLRRNSTAVEPPPAGGHLPSVATSQYLRSTREKALRTPGLQWNDEDDPHAIIGVERETRKMNVYQAVRDALSIALTKDDNAVVFGEDIAFGGVFRCTMGLAEEFGRERVFNTPLTEQGIAGFAIGMASMGHTAIAEIQFADYIFPAFDQLVNEAAKIRYRSGGAFNVGGLTVRTPTMSVGHGGLYHSQSPEGFFMGASGLKIVIPRSPIQAKGLLLSSIRDPNPVIFMEPKILYRSAVEQVPMDDYTLPLGRAETLLPGADLTLLTWGTPIYHCETALDMLANPPAGIAQHVPESLRKAKIELIDLRSILPWDAETVAESVKRTGRLVVVHEAGMTAGVGAEIAAEIQKRCFLRLAAPVKRVTGWDTPVALQYEKFYIPDAVRIVDAMVETLSIFKKQNCLQVGHPLLDYSAKRLRAFTGTYSSCASVEKPEPHSFALVYAAKGKNIIQKLPIPQPQPGFPQVRVEAAAVNPADQKLFDNDGYGLIKNWPTVVGWDAAGVVTKIAEGDSQTKLKVGDRIAFGCMPPFSVDGRSYMTRGAFQQYTLADERFVLKIPSGVDFASASTWPVAGITAADSLYTRLQLKAPWVDGKDAYKGQKIAILGGSSSVGSYAIQLAIISGFEVITTSSPTHSEYLKSLGAHAVINRSAPDVAAQILAAAGGALKYAVDTVSHPETHQLAVEILEQNALLGVMQPTLHDVAKPAAEAKNIQVRWGSSPSEWFNHPARNDAMQAYFEDGLLRFNRPTVLGGLEKWEEAYEMHRKGTISGTKLVLAPQQTQN
uniref:3-methyl-2-oxobutanoate dehydrogenase (2-methylpropanoyl-transferring) n=1 Tax=Mycena chlorophos TaxID=658473 RepID=A0ABQ0LU43_MYCCL|nr:pyruvate dehydrogenase [Mycena chlorophos]